MSNYFDNSEAIDAWLQKRRSRFTSSENYLLLKDGVGRDSYIEKKVIELTTKFYERPELTEVEALKHGKLYEYPGFEEYVIRTKNYSCLLYTSDAADDLLCVDLGGR